jgi:GT2 family glycosyltransferase
MKKISICIPTYNGERYIGKSIESVLNQTINDFELIVSNDCSLDSTLKLVQDYYNNPQLRLVENEYRLGLVGNWNRCIELASGEYIFIFHQDDLMEFNNVERKAIMLDQNPKVGLVFSNIYLVDEQGQTLGGHWNPTVLPSIDTVFSGKEFLRLLLSEGNLVPCQAVAVRSSCYQELGAFDPRLRYTPDLEMWLRIALHYNVGYIAEPLVRVRRHSGQESNHFLGMASEVQEVWRAFEILFSEQLSYIPEPEKMYDLALSHLQKWVSLSLWQSLRQGKVAGAIMFSKALLDVIIQKQRGLGGMLSRSSLHSKRL